MRRLFVLLMILLLPLRGWAGEVMAVQMATSSVMSQAPGAMPPDCHMLKLLPSFAANDEGMQAHHEMPTCSSCDLCLPIAELAATPLHLVSFADHVKRAPRAAAFLSVAPTQGFKPPIS